jgi:hypothetical protein
VPVLEDPPALAPEQPPVAGRPPPSEDRTPLRLFIHLEVMPTGPVRVRLRVPKERLPRTPMELSFRFIRLPERWRAAFVRKLPQSVRVSSAKDLELDFQVAVEPLARLPGDQRLHGAFDLPKGRHLPLWSLIPVLEGAVASKSLHPAELVVDTPFEFVTSLSGEGKRYRIDDLNEMYSGLLLVGTTRQARGSGGLRLASFDFNEDTLSRFAAVERKVSAVLEAQTGPRQPLRLLAIHRAPEGLRRSGQLGVNVGRNAIALAFGEFDGHAVNLDGLTVVHEVTHSSLPGDGKVPHWIGEGFTEFFALRAALMADRAPPEALRELVSELWAVFEESNPGRRAGASDLADYSGGVVLAHCLDVRLRRDGSSLEDVLKRARARAGGALTNDLWEQEMAVASASAGALVVNARSEPLDPPSTCFAEEQYVRRPVVPALSPATVGKWMDVMSVDRSARTLGVVVAEVSDGSPFQPGDRVIRLGGKRLISFDHFAELLAERPTDLIARLEVTRQGKTLTVELPWPWTNAPVQSERQVWVPAAR